MKMKLFFDTGQELHYVLPLFLYSLKYCNAIILSGAPDAYARYPKWAHSFENQLSLEFKTKSANGLLLYTDDGGVNGNFYALTISDGRIQLDFRLGDNTNDFGTRRAVNTIRIEEVRVDDDRWHSLKLFQSWENVKLELDYTLVFKILNQRSFIFGNILKNSDVFIGGIPPDIHILPTMSSPLRRHALHLAANVRNLMYRLYPQGITSPQLLDAVGARENEDDYCTKVSSREAFVCANGGYCYSTNDGPQCDCSTSEFEGKTCENEKPDSELLFSGQEWIGYDVTGNVSGPVRAKRENLTLAFKTVHGSAMLFYSGDEKSYLHLMLEDGALIATSKFDGTDARVIRMFNSFPGERYDDDLFHTIVLERSLQMMSLEVDGRRDEIRQYAPELDWIENSFAYVAGLPIDMSVKGINRSPFRGCMKKVYYEVDAHRILFVNLADRGFTDSVIRTGGELSFSCRNPSQPPDVLHFSGDQSLPLELPKWDSLASGTISFHFRTTEPDGLILYHGMLTANASDYIAFELIDGHLFMILNLGSGPVRLQTTSEKVSNGKDWISVKLERVGRTGSVIVNSVKTDFHTPGVSANLIIEAPIFLGHVPPQSFQYPPPIWTIAVKKKFNGCIKNLRINGISSKIANIFEQANITGVSYGCPYTNTLDYCQSNPCKNFGRCHSGMRTYSCDCTATGYYGPNCEYEQVAVPLNLEHCSPYVLPYTLTSEAEDVEIRFRTTQHRMTLFETKSITSAGDRILVALGNGRLAYEIHSGKGNHTFAWGKTLDDGRFHHILCKRRGNKISLFVNGKPEQIHYLPLAEHLFIDEITIGCGSAKDVLIDNKQTSAVSKAEFNGIDLLEELRKNVKSVSKENKGSRNIKPKSTSVSFTNSASYAVIDLDQMSTSSGSFRLQLKFQTLLRNSLLIATIPDGTSDSFTLEIVNARIRFSYFSEYGDVTLSSPSLPYKQHLSDMRWHNLLIYENPTTELLVLVVDNTTTTLKNDYEKSMNGPFYIGGIPQDRKKDKLLNLKGYRGCISALKIKDSNIDIIEAASLKHGLIAGCTGPIARCTPTICAHGGRCIQMWNSIRCDCSLTGHAGDKCQDAAATVTFTGEPSAVVYEYFQEERPTTAKDYVVMSFLAQLPNGVLLSIECATDDDFLILYLRNGYLNLKYNLGSGIHRIGMTHAKVMDERKHTLKLFRHENNITLQLDGAPPVRYKPRTHNELVTLSMHQKLLLGSTLKQAHVQDGKRFRRRTRSPNLYDPFKGEISGVNVNGIMMLELLAQGDKHISTIGSVNPSHSPKPPPSPPSDASMDADDMMSDHFAENPAEALIESIGPGCLTVEEHENCYIETESTGFFTPVLPSVMTAPRRATSAPMHERATTLTTTLTTLLTTTTTRLRAAKATSPLTSTVAFPVTSLPVRAPTTTTPMADIITTTLKATEADFPRTALISIASVSVITIIAIVVFCVFRCRQNPPPGDHYQMAMNGKPQSGYAPISAELSPPLGIDPQTQPLLSRPQINGNGYQPLNGSVIPNGNGNGNGHANGNVANGNGHVIRNGHGTVPRANGNGNANAAKKKDFKEWYV